MQTTTAKRQASEPSATLRDLSMRCPVTHLFGDFFSVKGLHGQPYRVRCFYVPEQLDFEAVCQCPVRTFRKRRCHHELSVIRFERSRVASMQFN